VINALLGVFEQKKMRVWRTSRGGTPEKGAVIFVDEMGLLLELYTAMDWVYVGGGFSRGVHSTSEPAVQGVPIAFGPARALLFPEIRALLATGQARIVRDQTELGEWLQAHVPASSERRGGWRHDAELRFGASARVSEMIRTIVSTKGAC
jgi:3-deoxy-D-manno-octulosonic-acid transferase